jgi:hypothetical protein
MEFLKKILEKLDLHSIIDISNTISSQPVGPDGFSSRRLPWVRTHG